MSGKESIKNWVTLFFILVATSFVAAVWPLIAAAVSSAGSSGGGRAFNTDVPTVSIPFIAEPVNGFLAIALLTVLVMALVGGLGVAIAAVNLLLNKQTDAVKEDASFQTNLNNLEKRAEEDLKALRASRPADPVPEHKLPRWSVVSTSLIVLLFTITAGMILSSALNISSVSVIGWLLLIALLVLAVWIRPKQLDAIEASDNGPIPWDAIWVIISGLLVVGLGVGLVVYFNIPG